MRKMIEEESGHHFDPLIVEAFCVCYPSFLEIYRDHGERDDSAVDAVAQPVAVGQI